MYMRVRAELARQFLHTGFEDAFMQINAQVCCLAKFPKLMSRSEMLQMRLRWND
jgi:hypothetical protein